MIKAAVVGFGYWGPNHVRNLRKLETVKAVCICDSSPERLAAAKIQYPDIKLTQNFDDIINDPEIEAVVIALPAILHYEFAKKALIAGKHVLVEKPITLDSDKAKELTALAKKQEKILMVGSTFLYNDAVREIKKYIDDGDLGEIYHIYFQRLNWGKVRQDVNAMWNLAPHDIAMTLYWLGEMPIRVFAKGAAFLQKGIEDIVYMSLKFKDGKFVQIHSSWLDPHKIRKAVIIGSKKHLVYDDMAQENKVQIFSPKTDEKFSQFTNEVFSPDIKIREPLFVECEHFIDCIINNKTPLSDGHEGIRTVQVLEAGQKSLKTGKAVEL